MEHMQSQHIKKSKMIYKYSFIDLEFLKNKRNVYRFIRNNSIVHHNIERVPIIWIKFEYSRNNLYYIEKKLNWKSNLS